MMIIYAQELLMLSKSSLAEVILIMVPLGLLRITTEVRRSNEVNEEFILL